MKNPDYILFFTQISIVDIAKVGGKNASLGEMYNQLNPKGIGIPNGFALSADAYRLFRKHNNIEQKLNKLLLSLDTEHYSNLIQIGETARTLILPGTFPTEIIDAINEAYKTLSLDCGIKNLDVAVATVAAAFYPKDVIVRMSDFKSNEYANLIGGKYFEPHEENPMIGLRGASRYYSDFYRKGFALECDAMKKVRNEMGTTNVKLMIPFCRTVEEGEKVIQEMVLNGLKQKENGLEIYVMIEIPSNVLLADAFANLFDGFSVGSNDLTQLTLGLDRDSALVSFLFSEENPAVKGLIKETIRAAKRNKIKVGLCGQARSDIPTFAKFLVDEGIDSISFNPDALIRGIENIVAAEKLFINQPE